MSAFSEEFDYPPIRTSEGHDLSAEQVKGVIRWYWESGQAGEDINAQPALVDEVIAEALERAMARFG